MKMIDCFSPVTSGELFGEDPRVSGPQIRERLGVVLQKDTLGEELTVEENL